MRKRKPHNTLAARHPAARLLRDLGEEPAVASVFVSLLITGPATAAELERRTGYAYSGLGPALRELQGRRWIKATEKASPKRGRNPFQYEAAASKAKLERDLRSRLKERMGPLTSLLG